METANTSFPAQISRKAYANDAGLFLVSPETIEPSGPEEKRTPSIVITGGLPADLATALYCLSFLSEFFNALESSDLRRIAEEIEARQ